MSAQRLNARSVRRIERAVGEPVAAGWAFGGYVHTFVTADHRHGWVDTKTWLFDFDDPDDTIHFTSCSDLFPDPADWWPNVTPIVRPQ